MTNKFKYPRTLHLPCSPGATSDDKMLTESQLNAYYCGVTVGYFEKLFDQKVAKYGRANHVNTDNHWAHQQIVPNRLKV